MRSYCAGLNEPCQFLVSVPVHALSYLNIIGFWISHLDHWIIWISQYVMSATFIFVWLLPVSVGNFHTYIYLFVIFTVRRSALHGLWDRNSVRLSVCPSVCPSVTLVDCVHSGAEPWLKKNLGYIKCHRTPVIEGILGISWDIYVGFHSSMDINWQNSKAGTKTSNCFMFHVSVYIVTVTAVCQFQ